MPGIAKIVGGRYEVLDLIGEGGMGRVYRAHDRQIRRDVALKTLRDAHNSAALDLFQKEIAAITYLAHPNIVGIFDFGTLEQDGARYPYFVMPLLQGSTLDKLIASSSGRLTVERCVDIIAQACRGLHAAHENGLVHGDIKPSNLFILDDDSVKIIDFGVARFAENDQTITGMKGTPLYMAPEQLRFRTPGPMTDVFSLALTCYIALTKQHPFKAATANETAWAILHTVPPPASEFNPSVSPALSQVIHKCLAKEPFQRLSSAREFGENLQQALRNEPISWQDPNRIRPRMARVSKTFESGDYDMASEMLGELEAAGWLNSEITRTRQAISAALRQRTVRTLLETANRYYESDEYSLALEKIQNAIDLDAANTDALALRSKIEERRSAEQVEDWFRLAVDHLKDRAFSQARDAVRNILAIRPGDQRAQNLLADIERSEEEYTRLRLEKESAFEAARADYQQGEVSSALSKLERVLELDRQAPELFTPDRSSTYQALYDEVRSVHERLMSALSEARGLVENRQFRKARALCDETLARYPSDVLFRALRFDIEEREREDTSAFVASVRQDVEAEPDLDGKVAILKQALSRYPEEESFGRLLENVRARRDLVNSIVEKARQMEAHSQLKEAAWQWQTLRTIYPEFPGLQSEIERVAARSEERNRSSAIERWIEQIDRLLDAGEFGRAHDLCQTALAEFPDNGELSALTGMAAQALQRAEGVERDVAEVRALLDRGNSAEAKSRLRQTLLRVPPGETIRRAVAEALVAAASAELNQDWSSARDLLQDALRLDPTNSGATRLRGVVEDRIREESITATLAEARAREAAGDLPAALAIVERALTEWKEHPRFLRLHETLLRRRRIEAEWTKEYIEAAQTPAPPGPAPLTTAGDGTVFQAPPSERTLLGDQGRGMLRPTPAAPAESTVFLSNNERELPRAHLSFWSCADEAMSGRTITIDKVPFPLGRGTGPEFRCDPAVSRQHAMIDWDGRRFTLMDAGSQYGTYLRGNKLRPEHPVTIWPGSKIRLSGSTVLRFASSEPHELPDFTGQTIGDDLKLVRIIRESIRTAVYEAKDVALGRSIQVKLLSPSLAAHDGFLASYLDHVRAAARLEHPQICGVLRTGTARLSGPDGRSLQVQFLCTPLMGGGDLLERLAGERFLPIDKVVPVLRSITGALEHAHREGVPHGGLKPTSIVFSRDGTAFVSDFGGAARSGDNWDLFLGDPDFRAPEQWEGSQPTPATDQYALAALTYLMVSGRRCGDPQEEEKGGAEEGRTVAPEMLTVLRRAMAVDPRDRYGSIREFLTAFEESACRRVRSAFISYRRPESGSAAGRIADGLSDKHNIRVSIDVTTVKGARPFQEQLEEAIEASHVFVCLLGNTTLESSDVLREIRYAWEHRKPMIPVFQECFSIPPESVPLEPCIRALLSYQAVHLLDRRNIHIQESIAELARMISEAETRGAADAGD